MKKLILAGGGHGHINILKELIKNPIKNIEICLITEDVRQYYSGMLPGFVEGIYGEDEISFDVKRLCNLANVEFINEKILIVDSNKKIVKTDKNSYEFDYISMNLGASSVKSFEIDSDYMTYVKPIRSIVELTKKIENAIKDFDNKNKIIRLVIVGCGASGVETALAFSSKYKNLEIFMLSKSKDIMEKFPHFSRDKAKKILLERNVNIYYDEKVVSLNKDCIKTEKSNYFCDFCIVSNGYTGIDIDFNGYETTEDNYLLVNDELMANSYSIAMGDMICLKNYRETPKAGVFAIRQAPILYKNLIKMINGRSDFKKYKPQKMYLQLVSVGKKEAILNYSKYALKSKTIWKLKDYIDKKYMKIN